MRGIDIAETLIGLQEVKDRKQLIALFKSEGLDIDPSTTPWCAAFVGYCERKAGKAGTGKLNARSYLTYGKEVDISDIEQGDIVVFARGNDGWSGHVTYFDEWVVDGNEDRLMRCVGGNQSDSVCYAYYTTNELLGVRIP